MPNDLKYLFYDIYISIIRICESVFLTNLFI